MLVQGQGHLSCDLWPPENRDPLECISNNTVQFAVWKLLYFLGENNVNETLVLGVFTDLCENPILIKELLIKEPVTELAMISCF